jgi:protein gp37
VVKVGRGARQLDPQWARDVISDCRDRGVAAFHKQWGTYQSNPLVCEQGLAVEAAKARDKFARVVGW